MNLSTDPFTNNRYAFGGGNPISQVEIDGHFSLSDIGHAALDVAGLVPGVGEVADLANAAWYAAEGDYGNAALSAASAIPFAGYAASAVKGAKYAAKGVDAAQSAAKGADAARTGTKASNAAQGGGRAAPSPQKAASGGGGPTGGAKASGGGGSAGPAKGGGGSAAGRSGANAGVEFAGKRPGYGAWTDDLSHVTGKTAASRNRAIGSVIKEDFKSLKLTHTPQYTPFTGYGVAKNGVGTQIGPKSFESRNELRNTIVHEELHHRWFKRGLTDHHPRDGSGTSAKFYGTVDRYMKMRGW